MGKVPVFMKTPAIIPVAFAWIAFVATLPAQTAAPAGAAQAAPDPVVKLETFNVSGSQIRGASTFTAPTPVLVID